MSLQKVKVVKDQVGQWYVIPSEMSKEFFSDDADDNVVDSGEFTKKWAKYSVGKKNDVNSIQLYAEI